MVYEGIRLTPEQIIRSAIDEGVHLVAVSILSGSHMELVPQIVRGLREAGNDVPVVVGGIIPDADHQPLLDQGVARIYTPKDYDIAQIMRDMVVIIAGANGIELAASAPAAAGALSS